MVYIYSAHTSVSYIITVEFIKKRYKNVFIYLVECSSSMYWNNMISIQFNRKGRERPEYVWGSFVNTAVLYLCQLVVMITGSIEPFKIHNLLFKVYAIESSYVTFN